MTARGGATGARRDKRLRWIVVAVVLALLVAIPHLGRGFLVSLALNALVSGLFAMSLDLLAGYTGLISLGHASFLGIGAYVLAYALGHGAAAWPAAFLAIGMVAAVAAIVGMVTARVKELSFAILTLAIGQLVWGLAYRWVDVSGGDNGITIPARPMLGPFNLGVDVNYYYFVLAVCVVCATLLAVLVRSPFGLTLQGVRENEPRMRTLGYNTSLHKYLAFVIGAVFAGVSGVLFAFYNLYVSPTLLDFTNNITVMQMVVVGGMGTLWGPVVGATAIVLVQQYVSIYVARWPTLLGIIFIIVVLFARSGIWGAVTALSSRLREGRPPTPRRTLPGEALPGKGEQW